MTGFRPIGVFLALALFPASGRSAPLSSQATYDAAQAAFDKGDWNAAAAGFSTLVPPSGASLSQSQAVIAARLGEALLRLNRAEEARLMAERAIAALPPSDAGQLGDAWQTLGDARRLAFRYPEAGAAYAKARGYAAKAGDVETGFDARIGAALALMTVDPKAVGADLDDLMGDKALVAQLSRPRRAQVLDLRARAALIAGDTGAAAKFVERAIDASGGLTTVNVSGAQVAIRNDAGLIYGLRHQDDLTRKYIAYTGAGHLKNMDWVGNYDGDLPVCGEDDISPTDVAAVQFAIDEHGQVQGAAAIYVSRPGAMGAAFGRAVSAWRWDPDQLKKVEPFWRATLVLQLRCQTRPTPESLGQPVYAELAAWLQARGVAASPEALQQPVAVDDARLKMGGPTALAAMLVRYASKDADSELAPRIVAALDAEKAPASAYALFDLESARHRARGAWGARGRAQAEAQALSTSLPALKTRFPDSVAIPWLQLQMALNLEAAGDFAGAAPLLAEVNAAPPRALPEGSPIRRVALLHAGLVARRLGQPAAADARIAASGLNAEQCSLFDTHPIMTGNGASSSDFPQEAMRWGFEGFAKEGFDIDDSGRVVNVRTLVDYPPFVFDSSSERVAKTFRYLPPKIGSQSVGCTGQTQKVAFRIGR